MQVGFASKVPPRTTQVRFLHAGQRKQVPAGVREAELSLKPSSRVFVHAEETLYVGVGELSGVNGEVIRRAAGAAAMTLRKSDRGHVCLRLEEFPGFVGAAVEGFLSGSYRFEEYKSAKSPRIEKLTVVVNAADLSEAKQAGRKAQLIGEQVNVVRGLGNQPGNVIYPQTFAEEAQRQAARVSLRCTVLDEKQLRARKFGGILAVGEGSARKPRFIMLEHRGRKEAPLVLVGKAVTFDTGGISIKPAAEMEKMIWDKCGGIAVLGAMLAIAAVGVKRHVIGLIPAAENMPSSNAYRPGDIVTCFDGKQVEIINTDAEGRMILADALAYARQTLNPRAMVDVATLTGACGIALGDAAAGLWSSDPGLLEALREAGDTCGERLWPMPLFPEYDDQIRSEVALVKNSGGRLAGACTGAAFLKTFAEAVPWAHLDIAYTAQTDKERAWIARGSTGFGVRTLVRLAEQLP